ncbi:MADF domain-containing protein [Aphis craccivora]|uniref:MADF domain-containing protein n=1 Tax=Aphis craccivora TaxID=307492 RepID=A0A6G0Y3W9_APHCR|nr:MADF domain-containing protein [Aphis craccivora]
MDWNEQNTITFIEMYEQKPILWCAKHPQYYNKIKRNDAWEEIAKEIGFSADECRKKMTGLSSAMRREKAKIKKSFGTGKGADEIYTSSWYAYNHMKFLWDKNTPCQTTTSVSIK